MVGEREPNQARQVWPRARRRLVIVVLGGALAVALFGVGLTTSTPRPMTFPGGKRFAFSIVDDTDLTTLERIRPIYDILTRHRLRTTKSVWVLPTGDTRNETNRGESLSDPAYLAFIKDLQNRGFEIALHGVRGGSSDRTDIIRGLEQFDRELGRGPTMHINHSRNLDNVYWDSTRYLLPLYRWPQNLRRRESYGHDSGSAHFWGDLLQARVRYVRQFTFSEINLLKINPSMPYHRPDAPYVNLWFQTSNGANINAFEALLQPENLDQLEREGGVCLVYAHLGAGSFNQPGALERFEARIADVVSRNGWFAPASEILDHLSKQPGWTGVAGALESWRMETQFVVGRVTHGVS